MSTTTAPTPVTDDTLVAITVEPHSECAQTLDPEPLAVAFDAIGLTGMGAHIGRTRLTWTGTWTVKVGEHGYRLEVVR